MNLILPVAAGGAIGAVARLLMATNIQRMTGAAFPWGTLLVNITGALLMGLIVASGAKFWDMSNEMRAFLTTGILGGFTTFSAFSLETALMIERQEFGPAAAYVVASVTLCVAAVFAGFWIVRSVAA